MLSDGLKFGVITVYLKNGSNVDIAEFRNESYDSSSRKLLNKGLDTPDFKELKEKIMEIANNYNYSEEDVQSDYLSISFYFHILLAPSFYKT